MEKNISCRSNATASCSSRSGNSNDGSGSFRNLERGAADDQTAGYRQLCADFGMQPTRNNPGVSHENGAIESPNGHLKDDLDQAGWAETLSSDGHFSFQVGEDVKIALVQVNAVRGLRARGGKRKHDGGAKQVGGGETVHWHYPWVVG